MVVPILAVGALTGAALIALLVLTLLKGDFRIWPTPGQGAWQSLVFWGLFRTLNLTAIVLAIADWGAPHAAPLALRACGLALAALCLGIYLRSLAALGPPNTYCGRAGLIRDGIYRWSRNPQYAAVIPAYCGLALAAASWPAAAVIAMLAAVYVLIAHVEEPWLLESYPQAYEATPPVCRASTIGAASAAVCGSPDANSDGFRAACAPRPCVTRWPPIYQERGAKLCVCHNPET